MSSERRTFSVYCFCQQCERHYEVELPKDIKNLPFQFECAGCGKRYEARLGFVSVRKDRSSKLEGEA